MRALCMSAVLAVLVARPVSPFFTDSVPPPWVDSWGPKPAVERPGPTRPGLPVPIANIEPFGLFGPSGRSASSSPSSSSSSSSVRDSSGGGSVQRFSPQSPFPTSQPSLSTGFPPSSSQFSPSPSSFSQSASPAFSQAQPSFSPSSHLEGSGFGPPPETSAHSGQQYQECPYGTVCVDEHLCPAYARSAGGGLAGPRTFNAFNQPLNEIQSGFDTSHGLGLLSHDAFSHSGGSCGYNKVCCKEEFVPHHHQGPQPLYPPHPGPYPPPPYHGGHLTYGGQGPHGGHLSSGHLHLGYGSHSGYTAYPSQSRLYSDGYGHGGYYSGYPQIYGGGYSQYTSYPTPIYPTYPSYTPYPPQPYPSYPQIPSYPPHQPYPDPHGGYGATPFFAGPQVRPDLTEADGQGSQSPKTDAGTRRAAPAGRTLRTF